MKRIALLFVMLAFATTGCGVTDANSGEDIKNKNIRPVTVVLNDGRTSECVVFHSINEGGLWCAEPTDR